MKSLIIVIPLSLSGILVNQASAEPFNDRGSEWSTMVSSGSTVITSSKNRQTLTEAGFNDRSEDWLATAVSGQEPMPCQLSDYFAYSDNFNDKSFTPSYMASTPVSGAIAASSSTRQRGLC
jgi:hypothetical protein